MTAAKEPASIGECLLFGLDVTERFLGQSRAEAPSADLSHRQRDDLLKLYGLVYM
jgi:hypothetical protein